MSRYDMPMEEYYKQLRQYENDNFLNYLGKQATCNSKMFTF